MIIGVPQKTCNIYQNLFFTTQYPTHPSTSGIFRQCIRKSALSWSFNATSIPWHKKNDDGRLAHPRLFQRSIKLATLECWWSLLQGGKNVQHPWYSPKLHASPQLLSHPSRLHGRKHRWILEKSLQTWAGGKHRRMFSNLGHKTQNYNNQMRMLMSHCFFSYLNVHLGIQ